MSKLDLSPGADDFTAKPSHKRILWLANDNRSTDHLGTARNGLFLYGTLKVIIDFLIAIVGIVVLFPLIIMVMGLLLILQGRPIFISHQRLGKDGLSFPCFKFRTMVVDAEAKLAQHLAAHPELQVEWEETRKLKDDPRITPLGVFLRKSSIDEIPQLFNILRRNMSLVGPRPITASEAEVYGVHFADYARVRPGLTGLWQISGRSDTTYAERIQLDVRYVRERTLWGDFRIMLMTIPAVMGSRGSY